MAEPNEDLSGGENGTVMDDSPDAFGHQVSGLSTEQQLDFFVGNSFFNSNLVVAPSSTTGRDGLGPFFNSRSCSGCHFKDGRGRAPLFSGEAGTGLLLRLSTPGADVYGGPLADPNYGGQFQDQSIPGVPLEGTYQVMYTEIPGSFPDGETYSLRAPVYSFPSLNYGSMDPGVMVSPRVAQQMVGLGLLETVKESDILANQDIADTDGDGISGKANYVYNYKTGTTAMGRFGWKANQPDLYQQTCGAFLGDIGITTWLFTDENCTSPQLDCQSATTGGSPEIDLTTLEKVVLYCRTLAVPQRRNVSDAQVLAGKQVFNAAGCAKCHTPVFNTGVNAAIPTLSHQVIRPYTDLLLHDMGAGLADGRPDYLADGNEWRTQPLWGIGLIMTVNGHTQLLHDGRARNVREAILWHGGEAENAKNNFYNLPKAKRDQLVKFIESL
jgi:CxxC motif-containing protein (DUF1111 family)